MSDIVEFLRARLDEDEAVARRAGEAYEYPMGMSARPDQTNVEPDERGWFVRDGRVWVLQPADMHWRRDGDEIAGADNGREIAGDCYEYGCGPGDRSAEHIVRFDPARVLVEGAAKREVVEGFVETSERVDVEQYSALSWVVRLLASVYSDHPDYRQEWTP